MLPEALEKWSVDLLGRMLPRHLDLIYLVNHIFIEQLKERYGEDWDRISRMSLIEEGHEKRVRMANLAIVCSHTVNGVAAIHSDLLTKTSNVGVGHISRVLMTHVVHKGINFTGQIPVIDSCKYKYEKF